MLKYAKQKKNNVLMSGVPVNPPEIPGEDVVNTALWKLISARRAASFDQESRRFFVNRGTIRLRQFLFCHIVSPRRHTHIDPRRGSCHRRSATVQNSVMIDRLEIKVLCGDIVQPAAVFFVVCLVGVFFQSQQKKTAPEGHGTEKQHWRSNFAHQSLNLRTSGCFSATKRFSWKKKKKKTRITAIPKHDYWRAAALQPYPEDLLVCVKVHALFNSWQQTDAAVFHLYWHHS